MVLKHAYINSKTTTKIDTEKAIIQEKENASTDPFPP